MKKITKRIVCGALSLMMVSTLAIERSVRMNADGLSVGNNATASADNVSFKNVTGKYDTSKLMQENFNGSVLKSENTAPVYETRTVIVTLSEKTIADRADGSVTDYLSTFSGNVAQSEIRSEQTAFLKKLSKMGISYKYKGGYDTVLNGVAIEINTKHVSTIKEMSGVKSVVITTSYAEPETVDIDTSGVTTNETDVYATGIYNSSEFTGSYGEGSVVAVLDTGLDYTHPAFQGFTKENVELAWDMDYVKSVFDDSSFALSAETRYSGTLSAKDVYVSEKVPFAFDYADDDPDVYPSYSNHGTHVAGIIGGYDVGGYTDKDGNPIAETFKGVVPDCQLVICKVFTDDFDDPDLGGALAEDIVAALDDCVKLGVDVINMSLGTSCGFSTTNDGDDEGEMLHEVYSRIQDTGITLVCAASNDYSAGYGGVYGTNLASNPDSSTVGSPSTFPGALSVASINGQKAGYVVANANTEDQSFVFFEESRDIDGNPYDFVGSLISKYNTQEFEYVVVSGKGLASDYTLIKNLFVDKSGKNLNRLALIERGDSTFQEKVEIAMKMGAIGVIVYNNVSGVIRMNLGEIDNPVPAISINMNAGKLLVDAAMNYTSEEIAAGKVKRIGTLTLSEEFEAGPFMSEFSSWGPTHDLKLKPEITAHGGEITSTVPGGYGEQSGTSMASPNMAGFMAIARQYIEKELGETDPVVINRLAMQLTMSTAGMVYDQDGLLYSPRKQGAGVAKLENVVGGTKAYLSTDVAENDFRPKLELGDDPDKTGVYDMDFKLTNFGSEPLTFTTHHAAMTETLANDKMTVSEQAHMFEKSETEWLVNGKKVDGEITVAAGETLNIHVTLSLDQTALDYLNAADKSGKVYFENGMYVEGFMQLLSTTDTQCDLSIPFLAFYGDWESAPMLDYSAFEVAECEKDASILEEDKIKASVWETLPYNSYYNETYILPMGGYVYLLPDDADPVYVDEAHCSVSRYNDYYGEGNNDNYMSSTSIKAVYAGLLRNARLVKYKMYNVETGELILEDEINRVGKAYTGGGSGVPANVELELFPEQLGLVANGKYQMFFEFFQNMPEEGEVAREEDTYSFSFTVDYDAPVLEDARVRYYNYKVDGEDKQRIYLDFDIYDNHYAMSALLCYPEIDKNGDVNLRLVTDYPTPVREANENGTTTVSIEITDIYEKYGSQLYLQIDDYAVNSCLYQIDINKANAIVLPEANEFALAAGEDNITIGIYEEHKVALTYADSYTGSADLSNFTWTALTPSTVDVKNGVIVGLKAGKGKVVVSNGKGGTKTINVTVTDQVNTSLTNVPSISFGVIKTYLASLTKASGTVEVYSGENFQLPVITEPWYHPMTNLRLVWSSSNAGVATVDQEGNVSTIKKGTATITAKVERMNANGGWDPTVYSTSVTLRVLNEFTASNYMLTAYNGRGYNAWVCPDCGEAWVAKEMKTVDGVANLCPDCLKPCEESTDILKIPSDLNVMYITAAAFEDNDNIKKIILPASLMDIQERAFLNCTALEEIYFVSLNHREDENGNVINPNIDWADLSVVYEEAFYGCTNLKKVDLSNVKTITLARDVFANCTSLEEIVDMPSIGTMNARAFANTALKELDLTGLYMSGAYVFQGCNQITSIKTGRFTALGDYMFAGCTSLTGTVVIETPKVGRGVFANCTNLTGVRFTSNGAQFQIDIGDNAFENCGTNAGVFTVDFGGENIRSIGNEAFKGSALSALDFKAVKGLQSLGGDIFADTKLTELTIGDAIDLENLQRLGASFNGCTVKVADGCDKYVEENGVIYNQNKTKILYANVSASGEDGVFTLPQSVTEIAAYAFANNQGVTEIVLHNGVEKIGEYAFLNSALTSVQWDKTNSIIQTLENGVFQGSKLSEITLPDSVISVGDRAFANSAITAFNGDGLQILGDRVFSGCKQLVNIALYDGIKTMGSRVFENCTALNYVTLPSVEKLGSHTFAGCTSLNRVRYGENATTTGDYTFVSLNYTPGSYYYDYEGVPVQSVFFLGNSLTTVGEGLFYGCTNLSDVVLPNSVTEIKAYAFAGCTSLPTTTFGNLVTIGDYAFYNADLIGSVSLMSAETIGNFAFATQSETNADEAVGKYSTLNMPKVKSIGNFAFLNNGLQNIELPASLQTLGYGAFASSESLTDITVEENSEKFFVEDGVLYRYIDKAAGEYELCFYPTTRLGEGEKGERTYSIKEGTLSIQAYAFYDLAKDALDKVTLPHSVNTIGDSAFFESGVKEYTFESIQAPKLEYVYRNDISLMIQADEDYPYYRGYYYTNFQTYIYNYSKYGEEVSSLAMNYPSNGTGYNNHIYGLFFKTRNASDVAMEDSTRECINGIEEMYASLDTLNAWKGQTPTDALLAQIKDFSDNAKTIRLYYNNALNSATQAQFITEDIQDKLIAVEEVLREVKIEFNIPIVAKELKVSSNSTHKTEYLAGETFDKTGLVALVVYDDYSTEEISADELTLLTTTALTKYSKQVELTYNGLKLRLAITVQEVVVTPPDDSGDDSTDSSVDSSTSEDLTSSSDDSTGEGEKKSGCGSVIAGVSAMTIVLAAGVVLGKKKED